MDMKQIKSSVKKFKPTKKALLYTGSFVLIQAGIYGGMSKANIKPFAINTYETHRVDFTESNKVGDKEKSIYLQHKPEDDNYILLKTPYEENYDVISRNVYTVATNSYSEVELNYIVENLDNQELLLEQDYIKHIIDKFESINSTTRANVVDYFGVEHNSNLPKNNDYEIAYMTINGEDKSDVKTENCSMWDNLLYSTIYVWQFIATTIIFKEYSVIINDMFKKKIEKTNCDDKLKSLSKHK